MQKKHLVVIGFILFVAVSASIIVSVSKSKSKQEHEENARDYTKVLTDEESGGFVGEETVEYTESDEGEIKSYEVDPRKVFPNGRFSVDDDGDIDIRVSVESMEAESSVSSELQYSLSGKTDVRDDYDLDEEVSKWESTLPKMLSGEYQYLYNEKGVDDVVKLIGHSLSAGNISMDIDNTVCTFRVDIENTDAVMRYTVDTAVLEDDGVLDSISNKYGSDYTIIYFENGVPTNSQEIYDTLFDLFISDYGVSDYVEGSREFRFVTGAGDEYVINLDTKELVSK